jgi:death-on-curing protein
MADEQPGEIEPVYLTVDDALGLYGLIIGATTAESADHLRSRSGLESALTRPATYAHYEDADLALQATVPAHGVAEGQLFIDGNKRTALVAMLTFLEINGLRVEASDPDLAKWILSFSAGASPEDVCEAPAASAAQHRRVRQPPCLGFLSRPNLDAGAGRESNPTLIAGSERTNDPLVRPLLLQSANPASRRRYCRTPLVHQVT